MTTKEILIRYQDFLKKDDFDGFYEALLRELPSYDILPRDISGVTEFIMINADIDPLDYMDTVPRYFLVGTHLKGVTIPQHIRRINPYAFSESEIERIEFERPYGWYYNATPVRQTAIRFDDPVDNAKILKFTQHGKSFINGTV